MAVESWEGREHTRSSFFFGEARRLEQAALFPSLPHVAITGRGVAKPLTQCHLAPFRPQSCPTQQLLPQLSLQLCQAAPCSLGSRSSSHLTFPPSHRKMEWIRGSSPLPAQSYLLHYQGAVEGRIPLYHCGEACHWAAQLPQKAPSHPSFSLLLAVLHSLPCTYYSTLIRVM